MSESDSDEMKWKNTFSGQEACLRTERTAAMEPRRYSESRVMAMCTCDGSQEVTWEEEDADTAHSAPLRYSGASANLGSTDVVESKP